MNCLSFLLIERRTAFSSTPQALLAEGSKSSLQELEERLIFPGMLAAKTYIPVIGVPIPTENLRGLDSLLSIVQMPKGIPVATVAIGGAENAGLLAGQILAGSYPEIAERIKSYRATQTASVLNSPEAKGIK